MDIKKQSILVITGSRSEYGLLRPVMREILKSKELELRVLVTGMHTLTKFGNTIELVRADTMPIVAIVSVPETVSMAGALAEEIKGIDAYCRAHRPSLILVLGDRDESFAGALVGGHLGIPVAHIHGGDKTGSVVDEYIRHATTKFSHLHFPATKKSARRIKLLGEESWRILMTGAPGIDELRTATFRTKESIAKQYGLSLSKSWHLVLHHPASLDAVRYEDQIRPLLETVASLPSEKIVLYPNADAGSDIFLNEIEKMREHSGMRIYRNIPREDLISMLTHAEFLIGNSSMGIIDCSFLGVPFIHVGNRQAMREQGTNVIDCGYDKKSIERALARARTSAFRRRVARGKSPYGDGHASERIVRGIKKLLSRKDLLYKKLTYT